MAALGVLTMAKGMKSGGQTTIKGSAAASGFFSGGDSTNKAKSNVALKNTPQKTTSQIKGGGKKS
jgi:hypothetical protein